MLRQTMMRWTDRWSYLNQYLNLAKNSKLTQAEYHATAGQPCDSVHFVLLNITQFPDGLNGVQEAGSSNLLTQTSESPVAVELRDFSFAFFSFQCRPYLNRT